MDQRGSGGGPGVGAGRCGQRRRHHHTGHCLPHAGQQVFAPASSSRLRTIPGRTTASRSSALTATSSPTSWSTPSKPTSSPTSNSWRRMHPTMWYLLRRCCRATADFASSMRSGWRISSRARISATCVCWSIAPTEPPAPSRRWYSSDCGITADFLHIEPNGRNINAGCGALHPEHVAQAVAASKGKYDLGITFDGDADRALFSDASGHVINGDARPAAGRARHEDARPSA